ncbi:MAG: DUF11 domain-containing protein, partial [Bacteroidetes bacterium]
TTATFDLALIKELADGQSSSVEPGDTVRYTITVINQGDIAADNIVINDYIPADMTFEAGAGDGTVDNTSLGWTEAGGIATNTLIIPGGLQPSESTTIDIFLTLNNPLAAGAEITNFAEIGGATNENGDEQEDVDSEYDDDPTDDDYVQDDEVNGNGNNDGEDDDDHDGATVQIVEFDLALIKTLADGQPMMVDAGDTVFFTITVINQGDIPADNILISDYIPNQTDGFLWDPTIQTNMDAGWMQTGNVSADTLLVQTTLTDFDGAEALAPGLTTTVDIALVVNPAMEVLMELTNLAEISGATDDDGVAQTDPDSPMDDDPYNDNFLQDNEVSGDGTAGEDEDNSDPASVIVGGFDLALVKTIAPGYPAVLSPGDTIAFQIRIINQGAVPADNIGVADYVPDGLIWDEALNPGWVYDDATRTATDTLTVADGDLPDGGLLPEDEEIITVFMIVEPANYFDYVNDGDIDPMDQEPDTEGVDPGETIVNTAEITYATDENGEEQTDIDSTPDDIADNDGPIEDDEENGTGMDGDDEDDHDIAVITVSCYGNPGLPNIVQVCLGCDAATVFLNFFEELNGMPDVGGTWSDDFGTGTDLSNPENVPIRGTLERPGIYEFTYTFPAINDCEARSATLRIEIVNIENLTCNDLGNISLGEDCEAEVGADAVLLGSFPCYSVLEVHIIDQNGVDIGNVVGSEHVGQTLEVQLVDPMCDNFCWGSLRIEDKKRPTIDCPETPDLDLLCSDVDSLLLPHVETFRVTADGMIIPGTISGRLDSIFMVTGYPTVMDNCLPSTVTVSDMLMEDGDCGDIMIMRTFTAVDDSEYANEAFSCTQIIEFRRPTIADLIFPQEEQNVACDTNYTTLPNGNPTPQFSGYFSIETFFGRVELIEGSDTYCNLGISYSDEPAITTCDAGFTFYRNWTITDWCVAGDNQVFRQLVRVGDFEAPTMTCPIFDLDQDGNEDPNRVVSTSPFDCTANFEAPLPQVFDNCSAVQVRTKIVDVNSGAIVVTIPETGSRLVTGLPIGDYTFVFTATDDCGNSSEISCDFQVRDLIEPNASCNDELNVSIGGGDSAAGVLGTHHLLATTVNEGSNDNCGEVTVQVRRVVLDVQNYDCLDQFDYDGDGFVINDELRRDPDNPNHPNEFFTPWLDYADFTCCDIADSITVELLVTDEAGNQNVCWQSVLPEDKLRPHCIAPQAQTLSCVDLPLTFPGDVVAAYNEDRTGMVAMLNSLFGAPTGTDNCAVDTIVENRPSVNLNDCGWGSITRRFEVWQLKPEGDVNANGRIDREESLVSANVCSQLITITEIHEFTIDFPEDAAANCADPCLPELEITAPGCDNIVVNDNRDNPQRFDASGDECYKLAITYDVINWCIWDGEYEGTVIKRRTEDDGEALPVDRAVESAERPVLSFSGPNESSLTATLDRRHSRRQTCGVNVPGDDSRLRDQEIEAGDDIYSFQDNEDWRGILAAGRWQYTQFIKVYDETAPVVTVDSIGGPTELCPELELGQFGDPFGTCDAPVEITFSVDDVCDGLDGLVEFVTLIDSDIDGFAVDANGDGEIKANEFVAEDIPFTITDNGDNTYTFSGVFPIIDPALGDSVYHAFRVVFEDGCGNRTTEYIEFDVVDCKAPAPSCINGITVTIMPQPEGGCAMATWASDFEASAIYDCTGQGPEVNPDDPTQERVTSYAIYRQATVENDSTFVPHPTQTGLVLTELDLGQTFVYVYAFDEEGNYDYCTTYIEVEAHEDCGTTGGGNLSGVVVREGDDATVEFVEVTLNGGMTATMTTAADGAYNFSNVTQGNDYTVTPYRNDDHDNGVTTFDIVLISKHILGTDLLDTPYKRIAADVNRSGTITTLDMIQIRKLILNIDTEFANNTSWRFVEAGYEFPNVEDPWAEEFPELYNVNNLNGVITDADFVAIKVGDVNGSARANSLDNGGRSLNGTFHLEMDQQQLRSGNTYTIPVYASELATIQGYQGTLQLQGAELVDLVYGLAQARNFGLQFAEQGVVTMSYDEVNPQGDHDAVLFSLVLRATADQPLSEAIRISDRYTAAEAYSLGGEHRKLALQFNTDAAVADRFELYQNTPNPFAEATLISFYLPEAGSATLTIRDISGRTIRVMKGDYSAGYHTVNLTRRELNNTTGVLSYTLSSGDFTATKKMIVVE